MGKLLGALRSLAIRYAVALAYILVGGAMFAAIENTGVRQDRDRIREQMKQNLAAKERLRQELSAQLNATVNSSLFENLTSAIQELSSQTVPNEWSVGTGGHFAFTVVSTIGYGVIVPTTDATRVATIFYAIIGIPLFLYAMSAAGELKKELCETILHLVETKLLKQRNAQRKHEKMILLTLFFFTMELLMASGMVYEEEGWSYFVAIYFWFITASTIGFGDYALSFKGNNQVSAFMMFLVILMSLILMSDLGCVFSTISDMLEARSAKSSRKKCFCLGIGQTKRENSIDEQSDMPAGSQKSKVESVFQNTVTAF